MGDPLNLVKSVIVPLISSFKPDDLRKAVAARTNLAAVAKQNITPAQLALYQLLAAPFKSERYKLTPQLVRWWLMDERPDFYKTLLELGPAGEAWLDSNIVEISRLLWG